MTMGEWEWEAVDLHVCDGCGDVIEAGNPTRSDGWYQAGPLWFCPYCLEIFYVDELELRVTRAEEEGVQ